MKNLHFLFILSGFSLASCGNVSNEKPAPPATTEAMPTTAPAEPDYKLVPFEKSNEFADAKLESMTYKKGKFSFKYSGVGYKLGDQTPDATSKMCANSAKGQHIHLIVDDQPYVAEYTPDFELAIPDGEHTIVAFLSRSYHESIKKGKAFIAKKVMVKDGSITKSEEIKEPMLIYSRPKGDYVGKAETEKVMLDFFLLNATLGQDYKIFVNVNHLKNFTIDDWQPYYLEGLPMGENIVKLTLIDKNGDPVDSKFNPVERSFNLRADPTASK
ncbi:MAG: hypothetical protein GC192_12110 [Bacteroidetes bacterium]|nr:hypothetical protein [Bacteroidota bacterium]